MKTTGEIKTLLQEKSLDALLLDIYLDEGRLDYQRQRYQDALTSAPVRSPSSVHPAAARSAATIPTTSTAKSWLPLSISMPLPLRHR